MNHEPVKHCIRASTTEVLSTVMTGLLYPMLGFIEFALTISDFWVPLTRKSEPRVGCKRWIFFGSAYIEDYSISRYRVGTLKKGALEMLWADGRRLC